jgi:thioredoxin 1
MFDRIGSERKKGVAAVPLETITQENFEPEVLASQVPFVLEFWAPWCPYCRRLAPELDRLAARSAGVRFGRVNVDEQPSLDERFDYEYIPTLFLFRNGQRSAMLSVPSTGEEVERWLRAN